MKEATGETNMTLVTIVAIGAVLVFATTFLPKILESIGDSWTDSTDNEITVNEFNPNQNG